MPLKVCPNKHMPIWSYHLNAGSCCRFATEGDCEGDDDHSAKKAKDPPSSSSLLEVSSLGHLESMGIADPVTGGSVVIDFGEFIAMPDVRGNLVVEFPFLRAAVVAAAAASAAFFSAAFFLASCSFLDRSTARILSTISSLAGSGGRFKECIRLMPLGRWFWRYAYRKLLSLGKTSFGGTSFSFRTGCRACRRGNAFGLLDPLRD